MASIHFKKSRSGQKIYYVVVSLKGRHKWIKAGSQKDARILKKHIESLAESERFEKLGFTARDIRIDDFFQDYLNHVRLHTSPNTLKRYKSVLNTFLVFLNMFHPAIRYLSQVKIEHIESYQQKRLESVELKSSADGEKNGVHVNKKLPKPQTVNYEIGVLRSAFLWAKNREIIADVPTRKVKKLKSASIRKVQVLTQEQCKHFLKTAKEMAKEDPGLKVFYQAFQFILNTGLRSGELCNLTWEDVDLEAGLIKIQAKPGWTPKSYERSFFLNQICLKLLNKIKNREGYIFKSITGQQLDSDSLRKAFIKIAKVSGFENLTRVHDLRHTFNSIMQMNGVDPATMGKILGHKDIETTMIYTHQTSEHLKRSIEKIGIS